MKAFKLAICTLLSLTAFACNGNKNTDDDIVYYHNDFSYYSKTISGDIDSIYSVAVVFTDPNNVSKETTDANYAIYIFKPDIAAEDSDKTLLKEIQYTNKDRTPSVTHYMSKDGKNISIITRGAKGYTALTDTSGNMQVWIEGDDINSPKRDTMVITTYPNRTDKKLRTSDGQNIREIRTYDDRGNNLTDKAIASDGDWLEDIYEYDENSFMTKYTRRGSLMESEQFVTYEYRTDERGNWIEQKAYDSKGVINAVVTRIIVYK